MADRQFAFGKNWQAFLDGYFTRDRVEKAKQSLAEFTGLADFKGRTFIDVGCGSGLFSLAAHELGASHIISFDVDEDSVSCCRKLHEREGNPETWEISHGSVLDEAFISELGRYDIVYSWGVLHHTGSMWEAITNASRLAEQDGLFYIGIYNRADGLALYPDGRFGPSGFWRIFKRFYSRLPLLLQNLIDYSVILMLITMYVVTLNNPVRKIRGHQKQFRGMSWRIDIKDWLGGYPYEYARTDEVFTFVKRLGFVLENLKCNNGLLNNEFLFRNRKSR